MMGIEFFVLLAIASPPTVRDLAQEAESAVYAGNYTAARALIHRARSLEPGNASLVFNQGIVCWAMRDANCAKAAFEEYLRLSPNADDREFVEERLRLVLSSMGQQSIRARESVAQAQILARTGRLEEAKQALDAAIAEAPAWAVPRYNLALVLEAQGKFENAVRMLESYIAVAEPQELDAVVTKVAELRLKAQDARASRRAIEEVREQIRKARSQSR